MTTPAPRWAASESPATAAELIEAQFDLDTDTINRITRHLGDRLRLGLKTQQPFQLPAFVTSIPNGSEKGTFLAIDLGGTNCRICSVTLNGDGTFAVTQNKFPVAFDLRVNASSKPLFAFIAAKLADFIKSEAASGDHTNDETFLRPYRLGFTFSFACEQTSVAHGTLIHWDKGWDIPEAIGKDPCTLLQDAIDNIKLPVQVCVLANDSVGTLLTRSYTSRSSTPTLAGVIFGTGTNAAYVERLRNITRLPGYSRAPTANRKQEDIMVINTEWGCLDDGINVVPSTDFDDILDKESTDPGGQMLEKRVSGLYLGELLRLVVVSLVNRSALTMTLTEQDGNARDGYIDSSFLSALARHESAGDLRQAQDLISKVIGAHDVSEADAMIICRAAQAIARRAARLAGAALAAVIIQSGRLVSTSGESSTTKTQVNQKLLLAGRSSLLGIFADFYGALSLFTRKVLHVFAISRWQSRHPGTKYSEDSNTETIDVGVDGSLIEFYPGFEDEIRIALRQVNEIGPMGESKIRIGMAKDGSGVGAALMAQATTAAQQ